MARLTDDERAWERELADTLRPWRGRKMVARQLEVYWLFSILLAAAMILLLLTP